MAFDISLDQRVSCFDQYDGVNDLVPGDLCDESSVVGQFLVSEFHLPAVF
jgi:hypothetical protein